MEHRALVPTGFTDKHRANLSNRQVLGRQQTHPMTLVYERSSWLHALRWHRLSDSAQQWLSHQMPSKRTCRIGS